MKEVPLDRSFPSLRSLHEIEISSVEASLLTGWVVVPCVLVLQDLRTLLPIQVSLWAKFVAEIGVLMVLAMHSVGWAVFFVRVARQWCLLFQMGLVVAFALYASILSLGRNGVPAVETSGGDHGILAALSTWPCPLVIAQTFVALVLLSMEWEEWRPGELVLLGFFLQALIFLVLCASTGWF